MNAYKIEVTLGEDGTLLLEDLPFGSGEIVEVIILGKESTPIQLVSKIERSSENSQNADYLAAVSSTMTEWESEADELAYHDL